MKKFLSKLWKKCGYDVILMIAWSIVFGVVVTHEITTYSYGCMYMCFMIYVLSYIFIKMTEKE